MAGKPTIRTGTLLSPMGAEPVAVKRSVSRTGLAFDGMPDGESPAQRTFHEAVGHRHIGSATGYQYLREHAFHVSWGHVVPDMPEVRLHLAIHHEDIGPKVAVMFRNVSSTGGNWTRETEDRLNELGWHLLVLNVSAVVQTPRDAVDAMLSVVTHFAKLELVTGPLVSPESADDGESGAGAGRSPLPAHRPPERAPVVSRPGSGNLVKTPRPLTRRRSARPLIWGGLLAVILILGGYLWRNQEAAGQFWRGGVSFRAKIDDVQVTKEGHASLSLDNGQKTFVPAHAVKHDPNLLHELIVAWRQGKPLTLFTTNTQHLKYGRQVGVKAPVKATPKPKRSRAPRGR